MIVYSAITPLDGCVNDATGGFRWAAPDKEVHAFVNDQERSVSTSLSGHRMDEVMRVWKTLDDDERRRRTPRRSGAARYI